MRNIVPTSCLQIQLGIVTEKAIAKGAALRTAKVLFELLGELRAEGLEVRGVARVLQALHRAGVRKAQALEHLEQDEVRNARLGADEAAHIVPLAVQRKRRLKVLRQ